MKNSYDCPYCGEKFEWDDESTDEIIVCSACKYEMAAPTPTLPKGHSIGGYEIIRRIGVGGMGEVYLATQKAMSRDVALKILHPDLSSDKAYIQRFLREVRTLASVDHPNISRAIEAGFDGGAYFLSMTFVEGRDIKKMIEDGKRFSEEEALRIARKVACALKFVWEKHRIIHRDVKPANIMIASDGEVKLMDLGIARHQKEDTEITNPGMMVGSPHYISPEQAKSRKDIDFRSDIYSLGATLYHILTGEAPFPGENSVTVLASLLTEERPDPRLKNSGLSERIGQLVQRMMAKEPEARFSSWDDLISEIDGMLGDDGEVAPAPEPAAEPVRRNELPKTQDRSVIFNNPRRVVILVLAFVTVFAMLVLIAKIGVQDSRRKKAAELYGTAISFIEENPDPLKKLRAKLEMLEMVQRAGDPAYAVMAKKKISEIASAAISRKQSIDRQRMESEFENTGAKAYALQRAGDVQGALKIWMEFRKNCPFSENSEYRRRIDREIDYLQGLERK